MDDATVEAIAPHQGTEWWVGPSMVLIENDDDVLISARTLTSLVSNALAGPTNDASVRIRDEAVDAAHEAIAAAYRAKYLENPRG